MERAVMENWQWKKKKLRLKPSFPPKSMSLSQKTSSDFAKPPKSEVTKHLKPKDPAVKG